MKSVNDCQIRASKDKPEAMSRDESFKIPCFQSQSWDILKFPVKFTENISKIRQKRQQLWNPRTERQTRCKVWRRKYEGCILRARVSRFPRISCSSLVNLLCLLLSYVPRRDPCPGYMYTAQKVSARVDDNSLHKTEPRVHAWSNEQKTQLNRWKILFKILDGHSFDANGRTSMEKSICDRSSWKSLG